LINRRLAENTLEDARTILQEAKAAYEAERFHRSVRLSQESFELSMKACLRAVGIEYPKEHEISDTFAEHENMFPEWFEEEVGKIRVASVWLTEKRGIAMYGDEIRGVALSKLFTGIDGETAIKYASEAATLAERLLKQLFG